MADLYEHLVDSSGTTQEQRYRIYAGSREIAQIIRVPDGDRTLYLHTDPLGTPETLSDSQESNYHQDYDAFGAPLVVSALTRTGFTGQDHDGDLGLVDMKGRSYDPLAGRFMSQDPVMQAPFVGQGLNRYSYVFNDPINNSDPSGFETYSFVAETIFGYQGGASVAFSGDTIFGYGQGASAAAGAASAGSGAAGGAGSAALGALGVGLAIGQDLLLGVPGMSGTPTVEVKARAPSAAPNTSANTRSTPQMGDQIKKNPGVPQGVGGPGSPLNSPPWGTDPSFGQGQDANSHSLGFPSGKTVGKVVDLGIQAVKDFFHSKPGRFLKTGSRLALPELVDAVKAGEDVMADSASVARQMAREAGNGAEPILHRVPSDYAEQGFLPHYHPAGAGPTRPHVFFEPRFRSRPRIGVERPVDSPASRRSCQLSTGLWTTAHTAPFPPW